MMQQQHNNVGWKPAWEETEPSTDFWCMNILRGHLNDVCASHSVKKTTLPGFFDLLESGYRNKEIVSWNKYIQVASFYLTVHHLLPCSQRRFSFRWGKVHSVIDGSSIYSLKWQFWKHISLTTQRVGGQWKGGDNWGSWKWNDVHVCQMLFPF